MRAVARDPKDDRYVAVAIAGRAEVVVTFDRRHLLALREYQGVRFVTPGDFLEILRSTSG